MNTTVNLTESSPIKVCKPTSLRPRTTIILKNYLMKRSAAVSTKILLANLLSLTYTSAYLITLSHMNNSGTTKTQLQGWAHFSVTCLLPVLTATLNPLVFLVLTPGSGGTLKDFVYGEVGRSFRREELNEVRLERCRSRRRRHFTEVSNNGGRCAVETKHGICRLP